MKIDQIKQQLQTALIICSLLLGSTVTTQAQKTIKKYVNGQWINWCFINNNAVQYVQNEQWVTRAQINGTTIQFLETNGQWINVFYLEGTTAREAVNGAWADRYYPNGEFIDKQVNGKWHREWRIQGNYIQEWGGLGWDNAFYFPNGYDNISLTVCLLDIGKFKVNPVPTNNGIPAAGGTSPNHSSGAPIAGGTSGSNQGAPIPGGSSPSTTYNPPPPPAPSAPPISSAPPVPNPSTRPNLPNGANCSLPMNSTDFNESLNSVNSKIYDKDKVLIAKQIVKGNCLTSKQIRDIAKTMMYDQGKLEFAKFAYSFVYDPGKYYLVNDAFMYPSNSTELSQYIMNR